MYYEISRSWFSADCGRYPLKSALAYLKQNKASDENIKKELTRLANHLLKRSERERKRIEDNISDIKGFMEKLLK